MMLEHTLVLAGEVVDSGMVWQVNIMPKNFDGSYDKFTVCNATVCRVRVRVRDCGTVRIRVRVKFCEQHFQQPNNRLAYIIQHSSICHFYSLPLFILFTTPIMMSKSQKEIDCHFFLILSYLILSYLILSYLILSNLILFHFILFE